MEKLSRYEKKIIEKLIYGEISDLSKFQEEIDNIKKKLSYKDYKVLFQQTPEIKLDRNITDDLIVGNLENIVQTLTETGDFLYNKDELNQSINFYEKALNLNNIISDIATKSELLTKVGKIYILQSKYVEAEEAFKDLIKIDENSHDAHNYLGCIYYYQKKYKEAMKEFNIALKIMPDNDIILNNISQVQEKMGLFSESGASILAALSSLEKLEKKNDIQKPTLILREESLKLNLGELYEIKGEDSKAFVIYNEVLKDVEINTSKVFLKGGRLLKSFESKTKRKIRKFKEELENEFKVLGPSIIYPEFFDRKKFNFNNFTQKLTNKENTLSKLLK